jgi:hypothetical protein
MVRNEVNCGLLRLHGNMNSMSHHNVIPFMLRVALIIKSFLILFHPKETKPQVLLYRDMKIFAI